MSSEENLTRVEFAVKVKDEKALNRVKSSLINEGQIAEKNIESIVDAGEARIVCKTNIPWISLHEIIEKTGYESALVGFSDQSAVTILDERKLTNIKGVVRFCSSQKSIIVIDGVIDGLKENKEHKFGIYEYGDLSDGCNNLGEVYKNAIYNVNSNDKGRIVLRRTTDNDLTISDIIGRGVCISNDSGEKLACGVISRSAGVFQNFKRICLCSGKLLWDERDLQNIVKK
ncbi:hypothetical protein PVAND_004812 [Polypedilum vanderplanki]|uniref:superoxide dismutase n=1 Tax=Polypedilum vanderplanki TaxID=319348 RepID=A0A9J6BZ78_POLVA|nr:hypothetical protein PVAND_004812 [Polypedilum vanderplanki]